jgi:hypothetical protein
MEGMASGWLIALAILKHFAERYFDRRRTEVMVLREAEFDRERLLQLQRDESALSGWLTRSGRVGNAPGEPVELVLADGRTLTGTVLRMTDYETLWSWDEIEGVLEIKAFRGANWGSQVGIRVMSWTRSAARIADLKQFLGSAVGRLADLLA